MARRSLLPHRLMWKKVNLEKTSIWYGEYSILRISYSFLPFLSSSVIKKTGSESGSNVTVTSIVHGVGRPRFLNCM